jgi:hypothetical protein
MDIATLNRLREQEEPLEDALGQDLLQAYLAAAYSVYLTHTGSLTQNQKEDSCPRKS